MSGKLPLLSGKEIVSFLKKQGFANIRHRGHVYMKHPDGKATPCMQIGILETKGIIE
jgi:predicted RNA binding protein YcfA (HicA-like mRNA interferase family)